MNRTLAIVRSGLLKESMLELQVDFRVCRQSLIDQFSGRIDARGGTVYQVDISFLPV